MVLMWISLRVGNVDPFTHRCVGHLYVWFYKRLSIRVFLPHFEIRFFGGIFCSSASWAPCVFQMLAPCQLYSLQMFPPFLYIVKDPINNRLQTIFTKEKKTRWWGVVTLFLKVGYPGGCCGLRCSELPPASTSHSKQTRSCPHGRVNKGKD